MQESRPCQKLKQQRASVQRTASAVSINFTNTAKLPLETVKLLIASVSIRPNIWNRNSNGQKRCDINALWQQVSKEVNLPASICRIKWGHLRDNFRKVFIRNTLSAAPPTTWRFYNDMRFMETAVAENVMRHHKQRSKFFHWQDYQGADLLPNQPMSSRALLSENCDRFNPNRLKLSELSAFFENQGPSISKRIKLESLQSLNELTPPPNYFYDKPEIYSNIANDDDEVVIEHNSDEYMDDEPFEENVASVEDSCQISIRNNKFSFENNTQISVQNCNAANEENENEHKYAYLDEQDSDRLFLLSLLPYLRQVKEQRKLYVRQKLQDVFIQEFG